MAKYNKLAVARNWQIAKIAKYNKLAVVGNWQIAKIAKYNKLIKILKNKQLVKTSKLKKISQKLDELAKGDYEYL